MLDELDDSIASVRRAVDRDGERPVMVDRLDAVREQA